MPDVPAGEGSAHGARCVDDNSRSSNATSAAIRRSRKFWFSDGTVVLQAETTRFRVHAGILAANSTFFEDLWRVPQPEEQVIVEGSPLVHMHSDTAQDWENMLTMVYYHMSLRAQRLQALFLGSLLRLGKKYQFDVIRDYALDHLKQRIPTRSDVLTDWPGIDVDNIEDLFDIANFAAELGIETVLPVVYWAILCRKSLRDILDGAPGRDGAISRLSPDIQRLLILKENSIRLLIMIKMWSWTTFSETRCSPQCRNISGCAERRKGFINTILTNVLMGPSRSTIPSYQHQRLTYLFCEQCKEHNLQAYRDGQLAFYDCLPRIFNMPAWNDLRDFAH